MFPRVVAMVAPSGQTEKMEMSWTLASLSSLRCLFQSLLCFVSLRNSRGWRLLTVTSQLHLTAWRSQSDDVFEAHDNISSLSAEWISTTSRWAVLYELFILPFFLLSLLFVHLFCLSARFLCCLPSSSLLRLFLSSVLSVCSFLFTFCHTNHSFTTPSVSLRFLHQAPLHRLPELGCSHVVRSTSTVCFSSVPALEKGLNETRIILGETLRLICIIKTITFIVGGTQGATTGTLNNRKG